MVSHLSHSFVIFPLISCIMRFKLHLRPDHLNTPNIVDDTLPPLPLNKNVVCVFADFLKWIFECIRKHLIEKEPLVGEKHWGKLYKDIDFIITHPNGWEGAQQEKMRRAAVLAELVPDMKSGCKRIIFLTEGESNIHYCLHNHLCEAVDEVRVSL